MPRKLHNRQVEQRKLKGQFLSQNKIYTIIPYIILR